VVEQTFRNRRIDDTAVKAEYGVSPSIAVYAQIEYDRSAFSTTLPGGIANRDSRGLRTFAGINADLAGLLRGQIAIGYTRRTYDSSLYATAKGLSFDSKLEFFLSPLTTLTLNAGRVLQDSASAQSNAYFDRRVGIQVDHALLRNLILTGSVQQYHQSINDLDTSRDLFVTRFRARYQVNRILAVGAEITYTRSRPSNTLLGEPFTEAAGLLSVNYRL
jgi:hypothetical protein